MFFKTNRQLKKVIRELIPLARGFGACQFGCCDKMEETKELIRRAEELSK